MTTTLFTGKANISLDQYPDSAWSPIGGAGKKADDQTAVLYEAVAWLYRCIQIRANSVQAIPWAVVRGENDVWDSKDPTPPPALAFLAKLPDLLFLAEGALCLTSEAFWFVERNRVRPVGLRWHAPSTVTPIWDEELGLVGYKRQLGEGKSKTFEPADYVYIRLPNFIHETKPGVSPAQAAMRAAGVLYHKDEYEAGYFERGAIKATLLQVPPGTPKTERDSLERWWNRLATGVRKAFTTIVISSELTPVVVGEGIGDLGNSPLTQEKKEDIATALGVPHSLVFSNAANFATATQDWLNYYDQTIIPEVQTIAGQINEQLLAPLGYTLQFRHEEMSVYQEDENSRADSLSKLVTAGASLSLAMEILGYYLTDEQWAQVREPAPVPEPVVVQMPPQPIPEDSPAEMPDNMRAVELRRFKRWAGKRANPDPSAFKSDYLTQDDKAAALYQILIAEDGDADTMPPFTLPAGRITLDAYKAMVLQLDPGDDEAEQKIRMEIENRTRREIQKALEADRKKIMRSAAGLNQDNFAEWAAMDLEAALARKPTEEEMYDMLRQAIQDSADLGVSVAVNQFESIGYGFDWTLSNQHVADWVGSYTSNLYEEINQTTRKKVRTAVQEWVNNGQPLERLNEELAPIFGRQRAELIASTEVTRAYAEGNRIAYQDSGVVTRWMWRTANDEKTCPICSPLDGATIRIDGDFSGFVPDEVRRRGTITAPPAHPRCRCWVVPVIRDLPEVEAQR